MKDNLSQTLPRFKKFNAFFSDLTGEFEPTMLTAKEKNVCLKAIASIDGESKIEFMELREDLELTAKVRETRRYPDGRMFVRFEFRRLEETGASCSSVDENYGFVWSRPYQLMAVFDSMLTLESYTVLPGRDTMTDGLEFMVSSGKPGPLHYDKTSDLECVLERLRTGSGWREVIIYNKATHEHFANLHGFGNGKGFLMYWRICCIPWYMSASDLTLPQVEACLKALGTGGIKALEDAVDWGVSVYDKSTVRVDAMLRRSLELAKQRGDEMCARTVRAVGVGEESISQPFRFLDVKTGTLTEMRNEIFDQICNESDKGKEVKLLAMLATRGHTESQHNLGYHFHFGLGVPVDYDLAIYWHTLAANAGDSYAMMNLGKIYSEKDGPRWDGPKAIELYEKAVAKGDTWAMGELGHCLLCGKCGGKNVAQARELLEVAVKANPDRKDFAESLEKAKKGEQA